MWKLIRLSSRPNKNLNFLIDLATITMVAKNEKTTEEEPKNFSEAWNHLGMDSQRKWCEAI